MCKYCSIELRPNRKLMLSESEYGISLVCPKCLNETILREPEDENKRVRVYK